MREIEFVRETEKLLNSGKDFVVATVVSTTGSSVGKPGFKAIVQDERITFGSLGGACPEGVVVEYAMRALKSRKPVSIRVHLEEAGKGIRPPLPRDENEVYVETFCGGIMNIFLEPFFREERLVLIGNGGNDPVLDTLIVLGRRVGFEVDVIDEAPVTEEKPDRMITDLYDDLGKFEFGPNDYVVLLTKGARDTSLLKQLEGKGLAYIGLMASRSRIEKDRNELKKAGVGEEFLNSIHWPIGIKINARLPEEIAVSIMAELISVRRKTEDREAQPTKVLS
ncbi:MAG: XdhC family protein [Candidatus Thermoplasmatota archaeon]|nr:XdhC family protein [Candidatus Thermoplasmatota archaeon]